MGIRTIIVQTLLLIIFILNRKCRLRFVYLQQPNQTHSPKRFRISGAKKYILFENQTIKGVKQLLQRSSTAILFWDEKYSLFASGVYDQDEHKPQ